MDGFKQGACLCLVLALLAGSVSTSLSAQRLLVDAEVKVAALGEQGLPASLNQGHPDSTEDLFAEGASPQTSAEPRPFADGFVPPEQQNLAGLIGESDIPVFADVDGQFLNSMARYQVFGDEFARQVDETTLSESVQTGRSFNRETRAAGARTEQAQAQTGQAFGQLLPNVSIRTSYGHETSEPSVVVDQDSGELISRSSHTRTDITFTATQPLLDLTSFFEWRRRQAKELARRENYRVSDGDAYLTTVQTYLSLVSTRLQAELMRDFEAQLDELLQYIEKRAGAGAASVSDMSRVRARSEATRSSRLEQESAHLSAGAEFVRLTNLAPQKVRLPTRVDVGASLLPKSFEMAVTEAMQSNPEIATIVAELNAEKIDRSVAKSRFMPRFDAEYADTYSNHAGGSSESQRDKRIMLVMNWNLFSGGSDLKFSEERAARYKELQYRLDDQRRSVVQALAANYSALATTRERINSGYQELESISTAAEAMSKRMLSGNQSLLDLLDVYDRYHQARARLVNLHTLEMNTIAQLLRLTRGTPWPVSEKIVAAAADRDQ